MRCSFTTGNYYDLIYTNKIVKSVYKNPNKKKITTTYSGIGSDGKPYRNSYDSYEYEILTTLVYEDNSTEEIKADLPIIKGWTVRSIYFNGKNDFLLKKFILENKYIISDSKTNPKEIIYNEHQNKLTTIIDNNKRSIILFFSILLFLATTIVFLLQKFTSFDTEILNYLREKIPLFVWIFIDSFFLISSVVERIRIHIKNNKAKNDDAKFFTENERIIEETYEEFCKYIMADRTIGRDYETIYELEINNDKYTLQYVDKLLICVEKIPICDRNGNPETLTRLYYDDFTSEKFKNDLQIGDKDRTVRYIEFLGRKKELLRQFILESDCYLDGTKNKPRNIILWNFYDDAENQIKQHKNSFFKRFSEIVLVGAIIFLTRHLLKEISSGTTFKEMIDYFSGLKFHNQIMAGIVTELMLFVITHVNSHHKNKATKEQEKLYQNMYERKINELQDIFDSYNTPILEDKLEEMENFTDIPF